MRTSRNHIAYATMMAISLVACWQGLVSLTIYAWNHDSSSHILLIPFISLYLAWSARGHIFAKKNFDVPVGAIVILVGVSLLCFARWQGVRLSGNETLCVSALGIVIMWTGIFLFCYAPSALRAAAFTFAFLLLMVPIPDPALDEIIRLLQQGSTEIAWLLFRALQVPVLRQGFVLAVPGLSIEVAKECSSIRSSMALLITCILAAHLYLRTWWKALLFVLLSLPLSVIKNGIRIATLTLLSVYVNPDFLSGNLHRDGGFVFFFLALLALWPIFALLEKSDRPRAQSSSNAILTSEIKGRGLNQLH